MMDDIMSMKEIESIYPGKGVIVTHMHASLLKRLCDTALEANKYKAENEKLTNALNLSLEILVLQ